MKATRKKKGEVCKATETVCPFCGALMALTENPTGLVHGLPICRELREAADVATFLERAAARVVMQRRGQVSSGRAKA